SLWGEPPLRTLGAKPRPLPFPKTPPVAGHEACVPRLVDPIVVRATHRLDHPALVTRQRWPSLLGDAKPSPSETAPDGDVLAGLQGVPIHAADTRLMEGRARSEPGRGINAASDSDVRTSAETSERQRELLA